MTSLRYFKDGKPEYNPYTEREPNVSESADPSDSQIERGVNLPSRPEDPNLPLRDYEEPHQSYSSKITELFNDLDEDLLGSIDEYLHNGSIKRGSDILLSDLEEKLKKSEPSLRGKRVKSMIKKENDGTSTSSSNTGSETNNGTVNSSSNTGSGDNIVTEAPGRSWSEKLNKISSRKNSMEEDEVIYITETTPPKISVNITNIDIPLKTGDTAPLSLNYEEDLPIKKSRLKIIPDSQRNTSSDNGMVKDEFGFTSKEIRASTSKCSCSNTCDHSTCNCIYHHSCHISCGVCRMGLLEDRLGSNGYKTNSELAANGTTSNLLPASIDPKNTSDVGEDHHSNVSTPRNKFRDSTNANRPNVISASGVRTNLSGSYDSDSSEEEEDVDECIICSESMKSELKNEIGVLDVCNHIFCFKCIKMWSDRANSCPLCKREFAHIRKVNLYNIQDLIEKYYSLTSATTNASTNTGAGNGGNGTVNGTVDVNGITGAPTNSVDRRENKYWRERRLRCIRKNKISKLKKIISEKINWFDLIPSLKVKVVKKKLQEEEDEGCAICGNDDNWSQLLLCDNCDKGYHMYCLDPPLTEVPANNWYCTQCSNEAVATLTGETLSLRSGSAGSRPRSGPTRGRGSRTQNNPYTENARPSRRSTRTRTSTRSLLESLLQNQADDFDFSSLGGSEEGIVSRASLENFIRDSIITISSTTSSPRTRPMNAMLTTGTRSRRQSAEAQPLEDDLRTNLLSQVYMGLNRSMQSQTRRATRALRSSIIARANRTRNNSAMQRGRNKRGRPSRASTTRRGRSVETSDIPETIASSRSSRGGRTTNRSETISTIGESVRGRSTSITNSILTRDFNPDRVQNHISAALRTNKNRTSPYSGTASDETTTESIKATVKGRLRRFNFNTKNVDQLIQESLESIDDYLAYNAVPTADIDLFSPTASTATGAFNRASTSISAANTLSGPTGVNTVARIPGITNPAWNSGIQDVTGPTSISYPITSRNMKTPSANNVVTEATRANNSTEVADSTSNTPGKVLDWPTNRDVDLLLSDSASRTNMTSDNSGPNITSSEGTGATQSSDTVAGKEKKYTSFIYRYKTITSDDPVSSTSQTSRQEPYINGKTRPRDDERGSRTYTHQLKRIKKREYSQLGRKQTYEKEVKGYPKGTPKEGKENAGTKERNNKHKPTVGKIKGTQIEVLKLKIYKIDKLIYFTDKNTPKGKMERKKQNYTGTEDESQDKGAKKGPNKPTIIYTPTIVPTGEPHQINQYDNEKI